MGHLKDVAAYDGTVSITALFLHIFPKDLERYGAFLSQNIEKRSSRNVVAFKTFALGVTLGSLGITFYRVSIVCPVGLYQI